MIDPKKKNLNTKHIVDLFLHQRTRGIEGFGFSYVSDKGYILTQRFEDEAHCFYALRSVKSWLIQFHHRTPTSTWNREHQNHPICCKTKTGYYSLTHNGVIHNAKELQTKHEGIEYSTMNKEKDEFNDSESLLHELTLHIEGKKSVETEGSAAFVLLAGDRNKKFERIVYGRNRLNPLLHAVTKSGIHIFASELSWVYPKNEDDYMVKENVLHSVTVRKNKLSLSTSDCVFPTFVRVSHYGSHGYTSSYYKGYKTSNTDTTEKEKVRDALESYGDEHRLTEELIDELKLIEDASVPWTKNRALNDISDAIKDIAAASRAAYPELKNFTRRTRVTIELLKEERKRIIAITPNYNEELDAEVVKAEAEAEAMKPEQKDIPLEKSIIVSGIGEGLKGLFKKPKSTLEELIEYEEDALMSRCRDFDL